MPRVLNFLALLLASQLHGACQDPSFVTTFELDHYRYPCMGHGPRLCYSKVVGSEDSYFPAYDSIQGLGYEWGHRYKVKVRVTELEHPVDRSYLRYELVELIEETEVPPRTKFEFKMLSYQHVFGNPIEDEELVLHSKSFVCATDTVCGELATLIETREENMQARFRHGDTSDAPIVMLSVSAGAAD